MNDYSNKTDEELATIEFWAIANDNHNAAPVRLNAGKGE